MCRRFDSAPRHQTTPINPSRTRDMGRVARAVRRLEPVFLGAERDGLVGRRRSSKAAASLRPTLKDVQAFAAERTRWVYVRFRVQRVECVASEQGVANERFEGHNVVRLQLQD